MTDTEIIERYFKARGWKLIKTVMPFYWLLPSGERIHHDPYILTDFPAFKEHVLEVMEEEGLRLTVNIPLGGVEWAKYDGTDKYFWNERIKDNNILHAAVQSATRYFESKEK